MCSNSCPLIMIYWWIIIPFLDWFENKTHKTKISPSFCNSNVIFSISHYLNCVCVCVCCIQTSIFDITMIVCNEICAIWLSIRYEFCLYHHHHHRLSLIQFKSVWCVFICDIIQQQQRQQVKIQIIIDNRLNQTHTHSENLNKICPKNLYQIEQFSHSLTHTQN